jgi:predicted secreted protein
MRQNAAKAAMARLAASLLGLLALAAPATAGDRALLEIIGYSANASFFAFEEFGIQDGSGFAYSNIFIVDLDDDEWVLGTPIRRQANTEETSLAALRAEARAQAEDELTMLGIERPAEIIALIGDGTPDTDAAELSCGRPGFGPGAVLGDYTLRLSSFPVSAAAPCKEWFGVDPLGYQLVLTDEAGEREIHRDQALPRSRGCPVAYRLHGVVLPFEAGAIDEGGVALISVYPGGFEGPDRRFLAVPLGQ